MLLEAVGEQEPGLAALSAGDVASFAVNDVAGSGEFGGPPWCAAGQLGGLGGQVCALACRAEDFAVFSAWPWAAGVGSHGVQITLIPEFPDSDLALSGISGIICSRGHARRLVSGNNLVGLDLAHTALCRLCRAFNCAGLQRGFRNSWWSTARGDGSGEETAPQGVWAYGD